MFSITSFLQAEYIDQVINANGILTNSFKMAGTLDLERACTGWSSFVLLVYTNLHLNCYPCGKRGKHGMVLSCNAFSHKRDSLHAVP